MNDSPNQFTTMFPPSCLPARALQWSLYVATAAQEGTETACWARSNPMMLDSRTLRVRQPCIKFGAAPRKIRTFSLVRHSNMPPLEGINCGSCGAPRLRPRYASSGRWLPIRNAQSFLNTALTEMINTTSTIAIRTYLETLISALFLRVRINGRFLEIRERLSPAGLQ